MADFYATGAITVAAGGTTVTASGAFFTGVVRPGDLFAAGVPGLGGGLVPVAAVPDATHLTLAFPWPGGNLNAAPYAVIFTALARSEPAVLTTQVRELISHAGILEVARPNYEVQSLGSNTPPGSPVDGDMYVVGTAPTGAWAGQANKLAQRVLGTWVFTSPGRNTSVVSAATGTMSVWNGTAWVSLQTALGYTPVNKAGDTMTGPLNMASVLAGGSYHLSVPDAAFVAAGANIPFANSGLYVVQNASTASIALFLAAGLTVALVAANVANIFSTSNGTANRINFFYNSGTNGFILQNNFASNQALSVLNLRTRASI